MTRLDIVALCGETATRLGLAADCRQCNMEGELVT